MVLLDNGEITQLRHTIHFTIHYPDTLPVLTLNACAGGLASRTKRCNAMQCSGGEDWFAAPGAVVRVCLEQDACAECCATSPHSPPFEWDGVGLGRVRGSKLVEVENSVAVYENRVPVPH